MIIKCPDCGLEIDDELTSCPHCGRGEEKRLKHGLLLEWKNTGCCSSCCSWIILLFLLFILVITLSAT
ncbi:MAG: hypothetical protein ACLFN5_06390 [bacterium]